MMAGTHTCLLLLLALACFIVGTSGAASLGGGMGRGSNGAVEAMGALSSDGFPDQILDLGEINDADSKETDTKGGNGAEKKDSKVAEKQQVPTKKTGNGTEAAYSAETGAAEKKAEPKEKKAPKFQKLTKELTAKTKLSLNSKARGKQKPKGVLPKQGKEVAKDESVELNPRLDVQREPAPFPDSMRPPEVRTTAFYLISQYTNPPTHIRSSCLFTLCHACRQEELCRR